MAGILAPLASTTFTMLSSSPGQALPIALETQSLPVGHRCPTCGKRFGPRHATYLTAPARLELFNSLNNAIASTHPTPFISGEYNDKADACNRPCMGLSG